eukprot:gene145-240_t
MSTKALAHRNSETTLQQQGVITILCQFQGGSPISDFSVSDISGSFGIGKNVCVFSQGMSQFEVVNGYTEKMKFIYNPTSNVSYSSAKSFGYQFDTPMETNYTDVNNSNTIKISGISFLPDCFNGPLRNPAHFLFGYGAVFDLGFIETAKGFPVFDRLMFLRCPDYAAMKHWPWGQFIYNISTASLTNRYLKRSIKQYPDSVMYSTDEILPHYWYCFDELWTQRRWGTLLSSPESHSSFRKQIIQTISATYSNFSSNYIQNEAIHNQALNISCMHKSSRNIPTELRIHIYERDHRFSHSKNSNNQRRFLNMDEVIAVAQRYTSIPVVVTTTGANDSFIDQFNTFNSFHILITSTGSHVTNMLLSPKTTAIVELSPVVRDLFWKEAALSMGLASYSLSTGHIPEDCAPARKFYSKCKKDKRTKQFICPFDYGWRISECNFIVDMTLLEKSIDESINNLCKHDN